MSKIKTTAAGGRPRRIAKQKTTTQGNGLRSRAKPGRKKRRGQGR
jgi:hypothetical protein